MSILSRTRGEIEQMVRDGLLRPENLRHYDVCKAMAQGMTQEKAAEVFGFADDKNIRYIKKNKCPDCSNPH